MAERGLGWDGETETGVVLHMVSALAVAGRIGLTAIGDTLEEARRHYYDVKAAVDAAARDRLARYHFEPRRRRPEYTSFGRAERRPASSYFSPCPSRRATWLVSAC